MTQPQTAPPEDDGAAAFIPQYKTVPFNGEDITIEPMGLLQSMQLAQIIKPVLPALDQLAELLDEKTSEFGMVRILGVLYADHGPTVLAAVAFLTDKPLAEIGKSKDYAGMFELLRAIVEINRDFFAQQVGKPLAGLMAKVSGGTGLTPSTPSSPPGTH